MTLPADRIQQLHTVATGQDKAELTILHNAVLAQMKIYQASSTAANLKDWQAAKQALADFTDTLSARHFPEQAEVTTFPQQKDALAWLKAHGFKVSAGKFSQDVRAGECQAQSDKSIRLQDLKAYASSLTVDRAKLGGNEKRADDRDEADTRKAIADADKAEIQRDAMKRELDAAWMKRESAEELICLWVDFAFNACGDRIKKSLPAMIHACGGDQGRLTELRDVVEQAFDDAGNDLAGAGEITAFIEEVE